MAGLSPTTPGRGASRGSFAWGAAIKQPSLVGVILSAPHHLVTVSPCPRRVPCPVRYNEDGSRAETPPQQRLVRRHRAPKPHAPRLFAFIPRHVHACFKPGRGKERHKKGNPQNFPKLWAFSHLGDGSCRLTQVTV